MRWVLKLSPARVFVSFLILIAAFFYFYNLENNIQFLADQGRDALIVSRIFTHLDPVFIGPVTSVGNLYLGPFYYYFMLPFLWLSFPSPLGPAYGVGLVGLMTVFLIYTLGEKMFGRRAAVIATVLYVFAPIVVIHSRFSWNPNIAPFFTILMVYFTWKAWRFDPKYWLGVSVCFSLLIQLHYILLLTLGGAGVIWVLSLIERWRSSQSLKPFIYHTVLAVVVFLFSLTPLVLFDVKHDFRNLQAFKDLFTKESVFTGEREFRFMEKVAITTTLFVERANRIVVKTLLPTISNPLPVLLCFFAGLFIMLIKKTKSDRSAELVIGVYLLLALIGAALYENAFYEHYFLFMVPLVALLAGRLFSFFWFHPVPKASLVLFLVVYSLTNFQQMKFLEPVGWTIKDVQETTRTIVDRVKPGEKYNIVLFTGTGDVDAQNYRYFLSTTPKPPLEKHQYGEAETLFIIEEERVHEKVTDSPVYEIVVFPNKTPAEVYTIEDGPRITVLRK